jgi:hypothetical protein
MLLRMGASGFRSSWERAARNSVFRWSASRSALGLLAGQDLRGLGGGDVSHHDDRRDHLAPVVAERRGTRGRSPDRAAAPLQVPPYRAGAARRAHG